MDHHSVSKKKVQGSKFQGASKLFEKGAGRKGTKARQASSSSHKTNSSSSSQATATSASFSASNHPSLVSNPPQDIIAQRRKRFAVNVQQEDKPTPIHKPATEPIVGTCTTIEKSYFRLTTVANPEEIRPKPILRQAYKRLKALWKSGHDMEYVMDQMKAVRQDLVIQGIADSFAVKVYETHARMALEEGDLNVFNQCQTALSTLYSTNSSKHETEFFAMNLLYDVITNNTLDLHEHIKRAFQQSTDKYIRHALLVLSAVRAGEYPYYMRLLQAAPSSNRRLMEFYLPVMQRRTLRMMLFTAMPSIPVQLIAASLEMSLEEIQGLLTKYNILFSDVVEIAPNRSSIQRIPV